MGRRGGGAVGPGPREALTLGKALSGLTAQAKGVRLGIYGPTPETVSDQRRALQPGEEIHIDLMGRSIAAVHTMDGLRAVRQAMTRLAHSLPAADLARRAFRLYEAFRPEVKAGTAGWGAEGELDLGTLASAARP